MTDIVATLRHAHGRMYHVYPSTSPPASSARYTLPPASLVYAPGCVVHSLGAGQPPARALPRMGQPGSAERRASVQQVANFPVPHLLNLYKSVRALAIVSSDSGLPVRAKEARVRELMCLLRTALDRARSSSSLYAVIPTLKYSTHNKCSTSRGLGCYRREVVDD